MTAQIVPRNQPPSATKSVLPSLEPWLASVQPNDRLPAAKASLLPRARAEIRNLLEPPTTEQIAVEIGKLLEWGRGMGMSGKGLDAVAEAYLEDLKTIPADLLEGAIRAARAAHRYGNRLPLAAEIRAQVQEEMDRRHRLRMHLETASRCSVEQADPPRYHDMPPEQKAKVDAMIEGLKQGFRW